MAQALSQFKFKPEIEKRLTELSKIVKLSSTALIEEAVEEYLDLHEWQIKAIQKGIEDADQGRLVDFETFKKDFYENNPDLLR